VVAAHGHALLVEDDTGRRRRCVTRRQVERPVTGDRVLWVPGAGRTGVVVALQPRHTALARPDQRRGTRPVAANLDQLVVVLAPEPHCPPVLVDRYLVAAHACGLGAVVLLNKLDRLDPPARAGAQARLDLYRRLGYAACAVSAVTGEGMELLSGHLRARTSALAGPSGVGKSSLVRTLAPGAEASVGELSRATGHGRHTTSASTLFHLPGGGDLIDSPGVRDVGLWHLPRQTVAAGFPELAGLAAHCRFRDCAHAGEPGCAVAAALAEGRLDPQRLASYRAILTELGRTP
jgi:ribosome biogenesis GTPase